MVAGILLVALGMKKTLGDVGEPLKTVPAVALLGGTALYLLAHVAFRLRNVAHAQPAAARHGDPARGADPAGDRARRAGRRSPPSSCLLAALIAYETVRFAEARDRIRHEHSLPSAP